jgi:vacuolar-type H+-ATPase subunit I/STV1
MDLTAQSVREWLTRVGIDLRNEPKTEGRPKTGMMQALSRQVQERERQIAELRAQLEALKVIDEDHQKRQRKMRAPASLLPNGDNRP